MDKMKDSMFLVLTSNKRDFVELFLKILPGYHISIFVATYRLQLFEWVCHIFRGVFRTQSNTNQKRSIIDVRLDSKHTSVFRVMYVRVMLLSILLKNSAIQLLYSNWRSSWKDCTFGFVLFFLLERYFKNYLQVF